MAPTMSSKLVKQDFYQWAAKWFNSNIPENTDIKPDLPVLICLMQAVGFKLRTFEKEQNLSNGNERVKPENIKITIQCGTSKMAAVLDMDSVKCECPDPSDLKDGSLWTVTGTEPNGNLGCMSKLEETGSNLLPFVSKDLNAAVCDILYQTFKMISNTTDVHRNNNHHGNLKDIQDDVSIIEAFKNKDSEYPFKKPSSSNDKPPLHRTETYDIPVNSNDSIMWSKNIRSSSPIANLEETFDKIDPSEEPLDKIDPSEEPLDKIDPTEEPRQQTFSKLQNTSTYHDSSLVRASSFGSNEEQLSIADCVVRAHKILEEAVNTIIKKLAANPDTSLLNQIDAEYATKQSLANSSLIVSPRSSYATRSICTSISGLSTASSQAASGNSRVAKIPPRQISHIKKPITRHNLLPMSNTVTAKTFNSSIRKTDIPSPKIGGLGISIKRRSNSNVGSPTVTTPVTTDTRLVSRSKSSSAADAKKLTPAQSGGLSLIKTTERKISPTSSLSTTTKFGFRTARK